MFNEFIDEIYSALTNVAFDTLIWIIWGSFALIFLLSLVLSLRHPKIKTASKRPYLSLVNAYTAVTAAAYLTANGVAQSAFAALLFWFAGYLTYGLLCLITREKPRETRVIQPVFSYLPQQVPKAPAAAMRPDSPAKSNVRLEHAMSVTDKLLLKNLGKSDRQELEKLKNTLAVLQMKGTLSPAESDILNDNFNALLKLMAKYNV